MQLTILYSLPPVCQLRSRISGLDSHRSLIEEKIVINVDKSIKLISTHPKRRKLSINYYDKFNKIMQINVDQ